MAHLRTLYRAAFLLTRKVIWYGMNGNGQGLEQVVHKHRTSYSGSRWLRGLSALSQSSLFLTKWVPVLAPTHLLLQRSEHLFTLRQGVEETCLICDDPLSISVSILVPSASWGPEHEDQEAQGTQDLKSKILELPVISESEVSWGILF